MNLKQLLKLNAACEYKYEKWQSGSNWVKSTVFSATRKLERKKKKGKFAGLVLVCICD